MGPSRLARHVIAASAAIAALVAALFVAVLVTVVEVRSQGAESRHHERTLVAVDRLERHLSDVSNGLSGYTITGRRDFLAADWERGRRTLPGDLETVAALTRDEPDERAHVLTLRVQIGLFLGDYGHHGAVRSVRGPRRLRVARALAARRQVNATLRTIRRLRGLEQRRAVFRQSELERANDRALLLGGLGLLGSVLFIAGLGTYVVRRIAAPVRAMVPVAERLRRGERGARVRPAGHPEVRALGEAFNAMAEELERDHAALERALADMRHMADHDALTGLLNRRALARELSLHCAEVARSGPRGAVILVGGDRFKAINDGFGHATGDEVIVWIAEILRDRLGPEDRLARLGGDEFAVLVPEGGRTEAAATADAIVRAVRSESSTPRGGCPGGLSVSVGVAIFEDRECPLPEEMLSDADWAMYDVKAAGRDGYAIAEPRAARSPVPFTATTSAAKASTSASVVSQAHIQRTSPVRSFQT